MAFVTIVASADQASRSGSQPSGVTAVGASLATVKTNLDTTQADLAAAVAAAPSTAAVASRVAVLVADGAVPTQAHVNDLNTDWGTFLTAENTNRTAVSNVETPRALAETNLVAAQAALTATELANLLVLSYDTSLTLNQIRSGLRALLFQIEGTF